MAREKVSSVRQRRNAETLKKRQEALAYTRAGRYDGGNQDTVQLAELTSRQRKKLRSSQFAIPERRAYPIHDISHARNALARVAQFGTPEEKRRVRAAVMRKFPQIKQSTMPRKKRGGK